jgi:hypothetical protein
LSYVDDLAEEIRRLIPAELIPDGEPGSLFRIYAVLALAKGEGVVLEDVHDAWAAWMSGQSPTHQSLKPLGELGAEVQRADQPYLQAIQAIARKHRLETCR